MGWSDIIDSFYIEQYVRTVGFRSATALCCRLRIHTKNQRGLALR